MNKTISLDYTRQKCELKTAWPLLAGNRFSNGAIAGLTVSVEPIAWPLTADDRYPNGIALQ
jgi:hypothetical protein